ncbi:uncharacterized protein BDZ99DRAFT_384297 [Mytilinidion resinicola]|uniref:Zn(2)-C6 fungal-type domain-containing protein n=1 Tax=Mytilinidion resinicola TaxID=574789 RepID=A0A6A6YVE0_9PEZI|nr:uncharacterized protein BDZ99DRAFT_384297 [Mytilinidion resinicola]KAF2811945.1 hypothetical protein BDZ99DRAFT_384297 [Mytilinidion resinicola]
MSEPERRRRRPAVSCSVCRKRKIRCNREFPCSNCVRSKNDTCVYDDNPPLRRRLSHGATNFTTLGGPQGAMNVCRELPHINANHDASETNSTSASTPASQLSASDIESMKREIRRLEDEVSQLMQSAAHSPALTSDIETMASSISGTFNIQHEKRLFGQAHVSQRSVMHKSRLFGQSHWINSAALFRDVFDMIRMMEPHLREDTSKVCIGLQRCKALAKVIKMRREPPWPTPPTSKADLPPKELADKLVSCYLWTTETIYRILHVPTFRKDYEALWTSEKEPDNAFLVQVKLVLAIGATTYDEHFSLRHLAIKWVYEAQTWYSEPEFKLRLSIQSLQTTLLLLVARETVGVGGTMIWTSVGELLRTAMYMGLHRDPVYLPKRTVFAAEMRRRLWNTILEVAIQSSMSSGGPPLVSLDDFNTEPPSNFDDEELMAENPVPKPEENFTQMSIAIALRKTLPLRLAITKFLNDLGSRDTYDETLRLDNEFRVQYKTLCQNLQRSRMTTGSSPSSFGVRAVDFIMRRYLSSLHVPFFDLGLRESTYAYSRKVIIETSLQLWCAVYPSSSIMASRPRSDSDTTPSAQDDFTRFLVCGSGFFRTVATQACFLIAAELKTQLQEQDSLGPVPLRPDLLSVVNGGKAWALQCMEAGESNIKGYLLACLAAAHIDGLMKGLERDELPPLLLKAAEEAEERCLVIFEEKVGPGQTEGGADVLDGMTLGTPSGLMDGWDFMMSDDQFSFGNADPMSWGLNDEAMQEPSLW